jgi:hypothetical protein
MIHLKQFKVNARRYASRQKRKLIHRAINPARYIVDLARINLAGNTHETGSARPVRLALVSDLDAYCSEQQFHPFAEFRAQLRRKLRLVSAQLILDDVLRAPKLILSSFDIIGLKMSYRTDPCKAISIVRKIRSAVGSKCIVYFDGDDDLCIQWPEILRDVDLYVKKHAFRDRKEYLKRFTGKSNLHDYVHNKHGYQFSTRDYAGDGNNTTVIAESGPVPADQLSKIIVGYNLAGDQTIIDLYKNTQRLALPRSKGNDIIFRGKVREDDWTYYLRKDIEPALRRLEVTYQIMMSSQRVSAEEYYHEMAGSKICISPFGFGEICWRDFEAILCRCLLIKPDMSHVETNPDIFKPYETYVPVKWDFSDLEEKCKYFLENKSEREAIVARAFNFLDDFYKNDGLLKSVAETIRKCPRSASGENASLHER